MKSTPLEIETHIATLRETPGFLVEVSVGLTDAQLRQPPSDGKWSMVELLAHLHACAEVWGDDITRMLASDTPKFTKPHPRQVMKAARFHTPSFAESLLLFTALRDGQLQMLASLDGDQWERAATIYQRTHTIFTHVRRMALHEAGHREQFRATRAAVAG